MSQQHAIEYAQATACAKCHRVCPSDNMSSKQHIIEYVTIQLHAISSKGDKACWCRPRNLATGINYNCTPTRYRTGGHTNQKGATKWANCNRVAVRGQANLHSKQACRALLYDQQHVTTTCHRVCPSDKMSSEQHNIEYVCPCTQLQSNTTNNNVLL